jgi:hypothetical protein
MRSIREQNWDEVDMALADEDIDFLIEFEVGSIKPSLLCAPP